MPNCDMCGAQGKLFRALVEGAEMMLCEDCSRFGKVIAAPRIVIKKEPLREKRAEKEMIETVVADYGALIKEKRERLGLNQENFAKRINEKESFMHKIESGKLEPSIELARKLENLLKIRLIVKQAEESVVGTGRQAGVVTIGDIIHIKSRKAGK